jgi:DNA-binding transcriptional ArsR family regulator
MAYRPERHIGDILKERNIILKGADAATRGGFTQVPNFVLKSKKLSAGEKMTFAMLLSYAWQNDYCFPGQIRLGHDLGLHETNVRKHLKSLEANGLLSIQRRGQGKTNIYELNLKPQRL